MSTIQAELFHDIGRRTAFAKVMGELEVGFSRKPSTARVDAYWKHLHQLDEQLVAKAALHFIVEVGKFPTIADWRKTVLKFEQTRTKKRGKFTRVEGLYCEDCEDTGWRFLAGNAETNGSPISVAEWRRMQHEEAGRGWVYRAQKCPCRETNPNYQCDQDEKTNRPPDIDRDRAKMMMSRYIGGAKGRW